MKVFISWSGPRAQAIGEVLRDWIPSVLQAAKPYFSPEDISKGARWSSEISNELESSNVGLLILTPDNLNAPWLLFEAGALAKNLEKSRVCPILFGELKPSDISGPLTSFQGAPFSEGEIKRVARMINDQLGAQALEPKLFDTAFLKWWPDLNAGVQRALSGHASVVTKQARPNSEMLEEVLSLVRKMAAVETTAPELSTKQFNDRLSAAQAEQHVALRDLASAISKFALTVILDGEARNQPLSSFTESSLNELRAPLEKVLQLGAAGREVARLVETIFNRQSRPQSSQPQSFQTDFDSNT
ncbi:toll/interleukin-1 receptor domain-containing protein [Reyranella sp.]|uniref:toll/interleukin-1 receptor domain-containing protein n=1 Tax=Reyranella sp. TaxID=1929291 RepID=UPI001220CC0A|nr:toll/interleukin-1 receptor domain-containing protein [Reyranella sp.]TAJ84676.1 MAG: toll/interleukin-1 receptor domain-containing protein [Reyranella sp.]